MNRNAIVSAIRSEEAALKRVGVKSLALVGSTARDTRSEASDVDVLIDVANEADFSLMDRIGVIHPAGRCAPFARRCQPPRYLEPAGP